MASIGVAVAMAIGESQDQTEFLSAQTGEEGVRA
jgi:hypothetical protein